jgi:hypothetical protein
VVICQGDKDACRKSTISEFMEPNFDLGGRVITVNECDD